MLREVGPAFFHFDENCRLPDEIRESGGVRIALLDTGFKRGACLTNTVLTESAKQAVEKDLRLALFITGNVLVGILHELAHLFYPVVVHCLSHSAHDRDP